MYLPSTAAYGSAAIGSEPLECLQGAYPPWPVPNTRLAEIYACLGDKEHTLEYLEKMFAERDTGLPIIVLNPEFAWMRSDPRFAALRQKVGLNP